MDINRTGNMYENFVRYQRQIQKEFRKMEPVYEFETINGNRTVRTIYRELVGKIEQLLR